MRSTGFSKLIQFIPFLFIPTATDMTKRMTLLAMVTASNFIAHFNPSLLQNTLKLSFVDLRSHQKTKNNEYKFE